MNELMHCTNIEKKNSTHIHGTHVPGEGAVHSINNGHGGGGYEAKVANASGSNNSWNYLFRCRCLHNKWPLTETSRTFASGRLIRIVAASNMICPSQTAPRYLAGRALTAIWRRFATT